VTARPGATAVTTGTVIVYDGEAWTVSGIEAGRLLLAGAGSFRRAGKMPACRDPVKVSSRPPSCHPDCHLCSYLSSATR